MLCDTANNETEALVKTKNEESVTPKSGDSENDEKTLQIIVAQEKSDKQQINDEKQQRNGEKQQMTGFKREASSSSLDSETVVFLRVLIFFVGIISFLEGEENSQQT